MTKTPTFEHWSFENTSTCCYTSDTYSTPAQIPLVSHYEKIVTHSVGQLDFRKHFSNDDECLALYFYLKFSGHSCRKCGRQIVANYVRIDRKNRNGIPKKAFRCRSCHTHIYPLSDTIFRGSTIPINEIFFILYLLSNPKSGVSAADVTSYTGISYKAVHRLLMRIRELLGYNYVGKLKGIIEIDEAFIGSGGKTYRWSGICSTTKQPIIGLIERDSGQARLFLVDRRNAATINKIVSENISEGATIYTDSWRGYKDLHKNYNHETLDHSKKEYARGTIHTNTIENLWGQLKRNLRKNHIKISDQYVQLYINEACWRYNSRKKTRMQLFDELLVRTFFSSLD